MRLTVLLGVLLLSDVGKGYEWKTSCDGCARPTAGPCMDPSTSKCSAYTEDSSEECGTGHIKCGSKVCQIACPADTSVTTTTPDSSSSDSDCDGCNIGSGPCKNKFNICIGYGDESTCPTNFAPCKSTTTGARTTTSTTTTPLATTVDPRMCMLSLGMSYFCSAPTVHHTADDSCPVLMCGVGKVSCIPPEDQKSMLACDRDFFECDESTSAGQAFLLDFQAGCSSSDSSKECLIAPGNIPQGSDETTVWSDDSFCTGSIFFEMLQLECCKAKVDKRRSDGSLLSSSCGDGYATCTETLRQLGRLTTSTTTSTTTTTATATFTTATTATTTTSTSTPTTVTETTTTIGNFADCSDCRAGRGPCTNSFKICTPLLDNRACPSGFKGCPAPTTTTTVTTVTTVTAATSDDDDDDFYFTTSTTDTTATTTTATSTTVTATTTTSTTRTTSTATTYKSGDCYGVVEHPICGIQVPETSCNQSDSTGQFARKNCPLMCGTCTSTTTTSVTTSTTTSTTTTRTTVTSHTTTTHTTTTTVTTLTSTTTVTTTTKTSVTATTTTRVVVRGAPCAPAMCGSSGNPDRHACIKRLNVSGVESSFCAKASADLSCFPGFDLCSDLDCPYADDPTCRSCNGIAEPGLCGITYAKGDAVVKQTCKISQAFSGLCPVICGTCEDEDRTTKTLTATTTVTTSTLTSTTATKTTTTSTSSTSTTTTQTSMTTTTHTKTTITTGTTTSRTETTSTSTTRTSSTITTTSHTTTTTTTTTSRSTTTATTTTVTSTTTTATATSTTTTTASTTTVSSTTTTYTTKPGDTTTTKTRTSTTTVTTTTTTSSSTTSTTTTTTSITTTTSTTSRSTTTTSTMTSTTSTNTATTTTMLTTSTRSTHQITIVTTTTVTATTVDVTTSTTTRITTTTTTTPTPTPTTTAPAQSSATAESTATTMPSAATNSIVSTPTTTAAADGLLAFGEFCNPREDACDQGQDLVCNPDSYKCLYITSTVTASASEPGMETTTPAAGSSPTKPANADGSAGAQKSGGGTAIAIVVVVVLLIAVGGFLGLKQYRRAAVKRKFRDNESFKKAYENADGAIVMGNLASDAPNAPAPEQTAVPQDETSFGAVLQTLDLDDFGESPQVEDRTAINLTSFDQPTESYLERSGQSYLSNGGDSHIATGSEGDGYITTTDAADDLRRNTSAVSGITLQEFAGEEELAC